MDGNPGPDDALRSFIAMCGPALDEIALPESTRGLIQAWQRLEVLSSALATVRTRIEVAVALGRVPRSSSGAGTSPMAREAADRLRLAINNVIALPDT
jgi:hypothetical protein